MFRSATNQPSTGTLLDGFDRSPAKDKSLPPTPPNPRESVQLAADDPVAIHLLVETALGDSRDFAILTVADVESLKADQARLTARIDALRRKLALECKVVEAAGSFGRLYAGVDGAHAAAEAETEEVTAARARRDEVARELYLAEGQLTEVQGRLLQHTAGILQMTHAGQRGKKVRTRPNSTMPLGVRDDGRPDSPASIYAYEHAPKSVSPEDEAFDMRRFYRLPDQLDSLFDLGNLTSDPRLATGQMTPDRSPEQFSRQAQEVAMVTQRLVDLNQKMRETLAQNRREVAEPPRVQSADLSQQIASLEGGLEQLREINQSLQIEKSRKDDQLAQSEKLQVTLEGLWQLILGAEAEQREQKQMRRERALPNEEFSDDEACASGEEFSLPVFSNKVQWLVTQSTRLKEQQSILRRQVQQQREMKEKSDSEQVTALTQQLDSATAQFEASKADLVGQLEQARQELSMREQEATTARSTADEFGSREASLLAQLSELEAARQSAEAAHRTTEASQAELQEKLDDALSDLKTAEASLTAKDSETQALQSEIERLEGDVVRLQTDVTIARAELDGAYGSRAERAKEMAATQSTEKEAALRKELADTLAEFEELTRATVEAEKEREALEAQVDGLRDRVEGLERELGDERVRWLGVKDATGGGPVEPTSTAVLRNEFKKMMRDTRAESMKALRAEQEERRRLEAQIRALKQGPGKSSLSQMTVAR